jgi:hypothetical protein
LVNGWIDGKLAFIGFRVFAMVDFEDRNAAEAWFKTQKINVVCAITARADLRVLANLNYVKSDNFDTLLLRSFRAILTATICARKGYANLGEKPATFFKYVNLSTLDEGTFDKTLDAFYAAMSAGSSAIPHNKNYAGHAAEAVAQSISAGTVTRHDKSQSTGIIPFQPSVFSTETIPLHFSAKTALQVSNTNAISTGVRRDAIQKGDLLQKPIWEDNPEELIDVRKAFSHRLLAQSKWSFWHTWYETMWNGTFGDWDLVFEVIKIPDNVWQGKDGAEKIANEITRIKATLKLKAEIATLKEKLQAQEDIATAGHNQCPPLDDTTEVHKTIEMIWPVLDDIEAETNKKAPSPDRLKILGQK